MAIAGNSAAGMVDDVKILKIHLAFLVANRAAVVSILSFVSLFRLGAAASGTHLQTWLQAVNDLGFNWA